MTYKDTTRQRVKPDPQWSALRLVLADYADRFFLGREQAGTAILTNRWSGRRLYVRREGDLWALGDLRFSTPAQLVDWLLEPTKAAPAPPDDPLGILGNPATS